VELVPFLSFFSFSFLFLFSFGKYSFRKALPGKTGHDETNAIFAYEQV